MRSALGPVHRALFDRLESYAPLRQAGFRTYDEPPTTAARYVLLGNGTQVPRRAFSRAGQWITETLGVWVAGASSLEAREGAALVQEAIEAEDFNTDGVILELVTVEFVGPTLKEQGRTPGQPGWRHVPIRVRMWAREPLRLVPGATEITSLVPGNGRLTVHFTEADGRGHAILDYEVEVDGGEWQPVGVTGSPAVLFFPNGTPVTLRWRAINEVGPGVASDPETATPRTVPDAPVLDSIEEGIGELLLHFTLGGDGGAEITDVEVQLNNGAWVPAGTTVSPIAATGLGNDTTKSARVRARNVAGVSAQSNQLSGTTFDVPEAPVLTTVTEGNGQLTFDGTLGDDGGSPVIEIELQIDNGSWVGTGSTAFPVTKAGLGNGTTYTGAARAVSAVGPSAESNEVSGTPRTVPGAPSIDSIDELDGKLIIHFSAPASNGGAAISDYLYSLDGGATVSMGQATTAPFEISPLTNGVAKIVRVFAENEAGVGAPSDPVSGTPNVPDTLPDLLAYNWNIALDAKAEYARRGSTPTSLDSWTDETGNGRSPVQATGSKQLVVQIAGGRVIALSDGIDDEIVSSGVFTIGDCIGDASAYTVVVAGVWNSAAGNGFLFNDRSAFSNFGLSPWPSAGGVMIAWQNGSSNPNAPLPTGTPFVAVMRWDGATMKLRINNGADVTGAPGAFAGDLGHALQIAALDGGVCWTSARPGALSDADAAAVTGLLLARYA